MIRKRCLYPRKVCFNENNKWNRYVSPLSFVIQKAWNETVKKKKNRYENQMMCNYCFKCFFILQSNKGQVKNVKNYLNWDIR